MNDHDTILQKIKALLRLAEDSRARGSLHEAEAAAARANEMVQRYRLDAATVEAATAPEERKPDEPPRATEGPRGGCVERDTVDPESCVTGYAGVA